MKKGIIDPNINIENKIFDFSNLKNTWNEFEQSELKKQKRFKKNSLNFMFIDRMNKKQLKIYKNKIVKRKEELDDLIIYIDRKIMKD
ncbi:MAG TPA: hypothetical protein DC057_14960 [Spirochaetia bacterium]|nr:hypothetical protein [Spirochaetia bacterium]